MWAKMIYFCLSTDYIQINSKMEIYFEFYAALAC